jgi:hypothetical protein
MNSVRVEVLTKVALKNIVFWNVTSYPVKRFINVSEELTATFLRLVD